MQKTIFEIRKMDCPSEENLIRMKLNEFSSIKHLEFDIPNRKLTIFHEGGIIKIQQSLADLKLNEILLDSQESDKTKFQEDKNQRKILLTVLLINFIFFILEMLTGLISKSMGLIADSLDMLADSFVYGLSLIAVGGSIIIKKRIAKTAGYFQIILAMIGFGEVIRRFIIFEKSPDYSTMIIVSIFALIANALCLFLLQKSKNNSEAHMKASMIFTSNDIIINLGVIIAGISVYWFNSNKPDLIIGAFVFIIVIQGAFRILKLGK